MTSLPQVFDFPSAAALAQHLVHESGTATCSKSHSAQLPPGICLVTQNRTNFSGGTAVSGVGCSAPGQVCQSARQWWHLLIVADDNLSTIPPQRFDASLIATCKSQYGHFVQNAEQFDHNLFRVSSAEAHMTDPSQRVLLRNVLDAATQAVHTRKSLLGAAVGVFVGASARDWLRVQEDRHRAGSVFDVHGSDVAAVAGRVSYLFGLKGKE
jgi:acyl transferase domain-containing protein